MSAADRVGADTAGPDRSVNEAAIITDYLSDLPVNSIRKRHHISWDSLYDVIDRNGVPRRDRLAARRPRVPRQRVVPTPRIYDNRFVRSNDDLVRLGASWLMGLPLDPGEINALRRFGIDPRLVGLRALDGLNPDDRISVCAALVDAMESRWGRPLKSAEPSDTRPRSA